MMADVSRATSDESLHCAKHGIRLFVLKTGDHPFAPQDLYCIACVKEERDELARKLSSAEQESKFDRWEVINDLTRLLDGWGNNQIFMHAREKVYKARSLLEYPPSPASEDRRIKACLGACEGMTTEFLERAAGSMQKEDFSELDALRDKVAEFESRTIASSTRAMCEQEPYAWAVDTEHDQGGTTVYNRRLFSVEEDARREQRENGGKLETLYRCKPLSATTRVPE